MAVPVERYGDSARGSDPDWVPLESPLEIQVNGVQFTVTMRTPGDDEALSRGLLFTEGVIPGRDTPCDVVPVLCGGGLEGQRVDVRADPAALRWKGAGRSLVSSSSCGLCGKTSLEEVEQSGDPVAPHGALRASLVHEMQTQMRARQTDFTRSGGTHAAAAFTLDGSLLAVFEDIGRHNAVDKVAGGLLKAGRTADAACLTVSGRVSFEIVSKAAAIGVQHLIAVSAPSSLAVALCQQRGITLIGFCRDGRFTVYSHPDQVEGDAHG
ncbi:MAG: formate dehydrogenase accessory sulfurtransferase FdhD [Myxococcota bacterium]|nr:formate dehydrogenase accessory sulfurtransferase FdhD [Myxococcota bacterium]